MLFKRGFGLISAMVAIAIIATVLLLGTPSLRAAVKQTRVAAQYNQVLGLIKIARQYALITRNFVSVCPSEDGVTCSKNWMSGILVFVDINNDQIINGDDRVVKYVRHRYPNVKLTWRAFPRKHHNHHLNFTSLGWTDNFNGTFRFCITGQDLRFNRALIVSKSGRVRQSIDRNGDGIHEDASRKKVKCK